MGRLEEIAVIVFIAIILFSPGKLLDFAKSLGSSLHEFKKALNPEAQNTQTTQAHQPVYVVAKAPARRARKTTAAKKTKASRA